MADAVQVLASDGETNRSQEAWNAFQSPGTVFVGSGDDGDAYLTAADEPSDPVLSPEKVGEMLADSSSWKLAVGPGDTPDVLEREALVEADGQPDPLVMRQLNQNEEQVLAGARTDVEASSGRLKEAKALPVASVGLLATLGSGLGLNAIDDPARPWLLGVGLAVGVAALVLSIVMTFRTEVTTIRLTRINELEVRQSKLTARGVRNAKRALALFLIAAVAVILAVFPKDNKQAAASATIGAPSTSQVGNALKTQIEISWSNLGKDVKSIRSSISQDGKTLATQTNPKTGDGTAKQTVATDVPRAGAIEVRSDAIDADGMQVGDGVVKAFTVP
jgi:hypothetical protein